MSGDLRNKVNTLIFSGPKMIVLEIIPRRDSFPSLGTILPRKARQRFQRKMKKCPTFRIWQDKSLKFQSI